MASVLLVCTGNICRSPLAHGFLAAGLRRRFPEEWLAVRSAGTWAGDGNPAMPEAIDAARELGVHIADHRATRLSREAIREAVVVLALAGEHRREAIEIEPGSAEKVFTLKELVRLLEELPPVAVADEAGLRARIAEAARLRSEQPHVANPGDEDVTDPLGMGHQTYRAVAWELDDLVTRLVDGLFGPLEEDRDAPTEAAG